MIPKPIVRWTVGESEQKSSIRILDKSIKNMICFYSDRFEYYVLYNCLEHKISALKSKYKNVVFLKQDWKYFPLRLPVPSSDKKLINQTFNGSFWKICPPRLKKESHEIILDNDFIFLKKSKLIEDFLSRDDKNLIIRDSNMYLGSYQKFFKNEKQGYNSGLIGLHPNYDFEKDLVKNSGDLSELNSYGDEQGLLMHVLYCTNPIIGSSEFFVGIHPTRIYLNCVSDKLYFDLKKKDIDKNIFFEFDSNKEIPSNGVFVTKKDWIEILKKTFEKADAIHFLKSNREKHFPWNYFLFKLI